VNGGSRGRSPGLRELLGWVGAAGGLLMLFVALSATVVRSKARTGIASQLPPFYGLVRPGFALSGLAAVGLAGLAALAGRSLARRIPGGSGRVVILLALVFLLAFAGAVTAVDGRPEAALEPLRRTGPYADYAADVGALEARGAGAFVRSYPTLLREGTFRSVHTRTHPPGPVVLVWLLERVFPRHLVPRALALAVLSSLVLVPTWWLARRLAGEEAAPLAVALLAVAPGPALFAFTSVDAVVAALLVGATAVLVAGLRPEPRPSLAAAGGAVLGLISFFTYATAFVAAGIGLLGLTSVGVRRHGSDAASRSASRMQEGMRPRAVVALAAAAAGGLAAIALLRLLGFDLLEAYRASHGAVAGHTKRWQLYWVLGGTVAWLVHAGVPQAGLALRELVLERPVYLFAAGLPVAVFWALPPAITHILPGENERTWQFLTPFVAIAAAALLVRARERVGARWPALVGTLAGLSALQAVAMEALIDNFF
jgi:hypothetical protein